MLGALFLALTFAAPPSSLDEKAVLDNGVVLYANAMPGERSFFLQMFVSTHGEPEKAGEVGYRHLIEHLVAKGQRLDLDAKLESRGIFLSAATLRDGIRFELEGPPEALPAAIEALRDFLALRILSVQELERETKIMEQEEAVRTWVARLSAGLWTQAFGATAKDPFGEHADLKNATPERLSQIFAETFTAKSICVAAVGAVDLRAALAQLKSVLNGLPAGSIVEAKRRRPIATEGETLVTDSVGRARGSLVGSAGRAETLAVLAAALALALETPGATVSYNPSPLDGLVALVHPSRNGLDGIDSMIDGESARLFFTGKAMLLRWVSSAERNPRDNARVYGQMLGHERYFRLEDMRSRAEDMTQADFSRAIASFRSDKCVRAGGER